MASTNHFDPEVSPDNHPAPHSAGPMPIQPATIPGTPGFHSHRQGEIPPIDVVLLNAYIAELESALEQRTQHLEELTNHYDSLLTEQNRAYQTWLHEVESEEPTRYEPTATEHQQDGGVVAKLLDKLMSWI